MINEVLKEIRKFLSYEDRERVAKKLGYTIHTVQKVIYGQHWNKKIFDELRSEAEKEASRLCKPIENKK
jgi:hypothetical protein